MKKKPIYIRSICAMIVLAIGLSFTQSCKKTEYEQLKRPYNEIQSFVVGGYGDIDSIPALIKGDEILIYWNAEADLPEKVRPSITVSAGATVSPASGEEVNFSETTEYTITAEDGTTRQYRLKPVLNEAIPVLHNMPASYAWASTSALEITGEYFMAAGEASAIKVYAQRLRDGFEFDVPIDQERTTKTKIYVDMPILTSELDTGAHRIYVTVGGFPSNSMKVWLTTPPPVNIVESVTAEKHGPIELEDEIVLTYHIKEGWEHAFAKYYNKESMNTVSMQRSDTWGPGASINLIGYGAQHGELITASGNQFKIKLASELFSDYCNVPISGLVIYYKTLGLNTVTGEAVETQIQHQFTVTGERVYDEENDEYTTLFPVIKGICEEEPAIDFAQRGQTIHLGQELRINYDFHNETKQQAYDENIQQITLTIGSGRNRYDVDIEEWENHGDHVTFVLPEDNNYIGLPLSNIYIYFGTPRGANFDDYETEISLSGSNTIIAN